MAPKKDTGAADLVNLIQNLQDSMDSLTSRFDSLDSRIDGISNKIDKLTSDNINSEKLIKNLSTAMNEREQHSRNSSVRIFGLSLDEKTSGDAIATSQAVYSSLLKPILEKAAENGTIAGVPSMFELIEYAHTLPVRKSSTVESSEKSVKPIIVRFQSRLYRSVIFKFKKEFLTNKSEYKSVFLTEDLTTVNYLKLVSLKKDEKVLSAWSMGGKIFYKDKNNPDIKKTA